MELLLQICCSIAKLLFYYYLIGILHGLVSIKASFTLTKFGGKNASNITMRFGKLYLSWGSLRELCDLIKELIKILTKELALKVVQLNGVKTGVLIHKTKWSRK